eukprot:TRINITY_DN856_c0_g1_i2.p1 TRINITY_DN856_c0_g1~~TRINITY_DN856_c0_g1_i2.p1  ORF type:complete len:281 (+),score=100.50 TRINITY_DN856_c0_g1_i2:64-906(+)
MCIRDRYMGCTYTLEHLFFPSINQHIDTQTHMSSTINRTSPSKNATLSASRVSPSKTRSLPVSDPNNPVEKKVIETNKQFIEFRTTEHKQASVLDSVPEDDYYNLETFIIDKLKAPVTFKHKSQDERDDDWSNYCKEKLLLTNLRHLKTTVFGEGDMYQPPKGTVYFGGMSGTFKSTQKSTSPNATQSNFGTMNIPERIDNDSTLRSSGSPGRSPTRGGLDATDPKVKTWVTVPNIKDNKYDAINDVQRGASFDQFMDEASFQMMREKKILNDGAVFQRQ